ncbi:MAG TPA: response regulator [Burkholderiaceae bacterium]|nr:response regulator [Burkholderiaceae bacterium]
MEILLVEDSPADVDLALESFAESPVDHRVHTVSDGEGALDFLHRRGSHAAAPRPDLVILDLNLPRKDGREVLADIRADAALKDLPVVVLTSSESERDMYSCYQLQANCYVVKPIGLQEFQRTMRAIQRFWLETVAALPTQESD